MNLNIKALEVYDMLDADQLELFRDSIEWSLVKTVEAGISPRRPPRRVSNNSSSSSNAVNFELGNYPLKPWINKKDNPG